MSSSKRFGVALLAVLMVAFAPPGHAADRQPTDGWRAYNGAQERRFEQVYRRGPTQADIESIAPELRGDLCAVAALWTIFPVGHGHDQSFATVVKSLIANRMLVAGEGIAPQNVLALLKANGFPATFRNWMLFNMDDVVRAADEGRGVFLVANAVSLYRAANDGAYPDGAPMFSSVYGGHLVRVVGLKRDAAGAVTHLAMYDVNVKEPRLAPLDAVKALFRLPSRDRGAIITDRKMDV